MPGILQRNAETMKVDATTASVSSESCGWRRMGGLPDIGAVQSIMPCSSRALKASFFDFARAAFKAVLIA